MIIFTFQVTYTSSGDVTAVGWYIIFSLLFIAAAMVEFAIVTILKYRTDEEWESSGSTMNEKIDEKALVIFQSSFNVFNVIYYCIVFSA